MSDWRQDMLLTSNELVRLRHAQQALLLCAVISGAGGAEHVEESTTAESGEVVSLV